MSLRLPVTAALLAASASVLAACSSSGGGSPSTPPPVPSSTAVSSSSSPPPAPSTPPASSSAPASSSSAPPTTTTPVPSSASSSVRAQPRSTCTSLTIRVIRGSGVTGREFAALQFTNTGTSACMLYGYPTVTLSRGGKRIGRASQPAGTATSALRLGPEGTAESKLNDYVMNCNAALSDTITVVAPGSTQRTSRPGELRACLLRTSPLGQPD